MKYFIEGNVEIEIDEEDLPTLQSSNWIIKLNILGDESLVDN